MVRRITRCVCGALSHCVIQGHLPVLLDIRTAFLVEHVCWCYTWCHEAPAAKGSTLAAYCSTQGHLRPMSLPHTARRRHHCSIPLNLLQYFRYTSAVTRLQVGLKYGLPLLSPVDDAGKFTEEAGPRFAGKNVQVRESFHAQQHSIRHEGGACCGIAVCVKASGLVFWCGWSLNDHSRLSCVQETPGRHAGVQA